MKFRFLTTSIALASALAVSTAAFADGYGRGSLKDAPYVAPFSWTGAYVGVNAGYAWSDSKIGSSFSCGAACPFTAASNDFLGAVNSGTLSADGFTGGVQAGYNIQSGNIVYGAEVDFNWLGAEAGMGVTGITPGGTNFASSATMSADWLFTARARLGVTLSPTLLAYVTGGLAVTDLETSNSFTTIGLVPPQITGGTSHSTTRAGWTIGGGMEYALNRNWTFKAEYLYVDFGSVSTTSIVNQNPIGAFGNSAFGTSADLTMHVARAGINYKF